MKSDLSIFLSNDIIYLIFLILLPLLYTIPNDINAQIILTEIMFDADTLESHNEFVEIFNVADSSIYLENWRIGDDQEEDAIVGAGYGLVLTPNQYAIILDGSYFGNSTIYDSLIPPEALITTIEDGSFGSYGWSNSDAEPVILLNPAGDTIQTYIYSLDNSPGISDEKIMLNGDNSAENWGNSLNLRGTPGQLNSITPLEWDVSVDSLKINPFFPLEDESFGLKIIIKNRGTNFVNNLNLLIFNDENRNQHVESNEILLDKALYANLNFTDTMQVSSELNGLRAGRYVLGAYLDFNPDQRIENNYLFKEIVIENAENPLVINEIMYRPLPGKSEWLELYNLTNEDVYLDNWAVVDTRDTARILVTNIKISGNDYFVIAEDSTFFDIFSVSMDKVIILSSFPTLNNDFDDLKLISSSNRLVDRVTYSNSWMGRDVEAGVSLERINPLISSSLIENWAASVNPFGATPGGVNSVFVAKKTASSIITIQPNPFSPDSDGFEDFAIIDYSLPITTGFLTIDIYDVLGRRIKRLVNRQPVAQSGQFIWDGSDTQGRKSRIGIYILLIQIFNPNQDLYKQVKKTVVLTKK